MNKNCLFLLSRVVSFIPHAPWSTVRSPTLPFTQPFGREVGTRKYYNFNMNFESCNFREIKKITCESSRGLSQMVKVDEYQDTITTLPIRGSVDANIKK